MPTYRVLARRIQDVVLLVEAENESDIDDTLARCDVISEELIDDSLNDTYAIDTVEEFDA